MLACEDKGKLERQMQAWFDRMAMFGLKLNRHGDEDAALDDWSHAHGPHPNDAIRQTFGVAPIADKLRKARLRWYGHVLRGK
ncbi:unnamed protein product [Heligmosomoides polygyrus]|uniref:SCP domain-containing protein n=1 Tax=Heligmosomoides polygyrus TaxID=6339 RepID=A0A183G7H1_HELPZ|nr:unnamed protein product [Heligmosomoides polygyrus]